MAHQLPVAGVVEAVIDGVREGCRTFGVQAKLIGIMSRTRRSRLSARAGGLFSPP